MRTIKFKGYSIEDNKFIFGYLFKDPITFNYYIIEENSTKDTMNIVLVEKDSIGQFTGLCDIGGKEPLKEILPVTIIETNPYRLSDPCLFKSYKELESTNTTFRYNKE